MVADFVTCNLYLSGQVVRRTVNITMLCGLLNTHTAGCDGEETKCCSICAREFVFMIHSLDRFTINHATLQCAVQDKLTANRGSHFEALLTNSSGTTEENNKTCNVRIT